MRKQLERFTPNDIHEDAERNNLLMMLNALKDPGIPFSPIQLAGFRDRVEHLMRHEKHPNRLDIDER